MTKTHCMLQKMRLANELDASFLPPGPLARQERKHCIRRRRFLRVQIIWTIGAQWKRYSITPCGGRAANHEAHLQKATRLRLSDDPVVFCCSTPRVDTQRYRQHLFQRRPSFNAGVGIMPPPIGYSARCGEARSQIRQVPKFVDIYVYV